MQTHSFTRIYNKPINKITCFCDKCICSHKIKEMRENIVYFS